MSIFSGSIWLLIGLAVAFDFLNGFRDGSSIVAAAIASRALSRRQALVLTALAEWIGPFVFGVAVATAFGNQVVVSDQVRPSAILAALVAGILWDIITWRLGIPSSSSHALVGGLIGAVLDESGWSAIKIVGLSKVLLALAIAPPVGLMAGYFVMKLMLFLARGASPRINFILKRSQVATALALALSYGANDAQKTMGILTLGLVSAGMLPAFRVPLWVIAMCATSIALGTTVGTGRLVQTLGSKLYRLRPVHSFTSQIASASVILTAAALGGPVSTTQVVSTTIMGVGSAQRISQVRWGVAEHIVFAWLMTMPFTALVSAGLAAVLKRWM